MKLHFDSNQDYQLQAVRSIVTLFEGQPLSVGEFEFSMRSAVTSLELNEYGIGNSIQLTEGEVLDNVRKIQRANGLPQSPQLNGKHFSVEMETGTGKTYVYLRTIYELNRVYGFKKFIIVVPSIAIREGVLKNLQITHEHFQDLYTRVPLSYNVYDSRNVSILRGFASSNTIQVLVINIDSFAKDDNVINKPNDRLTGNKPIEFIQHTNPIVIVDEPQNMETEIRRKAIENLHPICTLRYSATHTNLYNQVYKLSPVRAYDLGLVKQIEVDSVMSEKSFNQAFIRMVGIKVQKTRLTAKLTIDVMGAEGVIRRTFTVKNGDNLYDLSNERDQYRDGYIVNEINAEDRYVEFSGGVRLELGASQGAYHDDIMKVQMRKAIEEHFRKEAKLKPLGIKVLTLFFIDKVKNYRLYNDGAPVKGKFAGWFEAIYREFASKPEYEGMIPFSEEAVHDGYFAQDKKGILKDSREGKPSEDDISAYQKIMQRKELLLDSAEPLRFIFSHSALREGWDNPNVFQLCTLNETKSELKKRQEIGRGLRLAVNSDGNRVFEKSINRLTVVANESYDDFARQLQKEIEEDTGEKFEGRIKKKEDKVQVRLKKGYETDPAFLALWERIRQRTSYRVQYSTEELTREAAKRVKQMEPIVTPRIIAQRTQVVMQKTGIVGETRQTQVHRLESSGVEIPDLLGYVQSKTDLTRSTIMRIFEESGRLCDALKNPQMYLDCVVREIRAVLAEVMVQGVKYLKLAGEVYEMQLFADGEIEAYIDNLYTVRKQEKTLYNYVEIDSLSEPEKRFAKDCEDNEDVAFFFKLPRKFTIKTPIGNYTPDWALVLKGLQKLYFVAETKSHLHYGDLRSNEWQRIQCGYRHFDEFPEVEFKHVRNLRDLQT